MNIIFAVVGYNQHGNKTGYEQQFWTYPAEGQIKNCLEYVDSGGYVMIEKRHYHED